MTIKTQAGSLSPDKTYTLTLRHGDSERVMKNAKVIVEERVERDYDDEGIAVGKHTETHFSASGSYELLDPFSGEPYDHEATVGFLPENVLKAEEVK